MGQGKGPPERVVVIVLSGTALGRHAGVAHGEAGIVPQIEVQLVAGNGPLVDVERPAVIVGHPRGVRPPGLAGGGQGVEHF